MILQKLFILVLQISLINMGGGSVGKQCTVLYTCSVPRPIKMIQLPAASQTDTSRLLHSHHFCHKTLYICTLFKIVVGAGASWELDL
jgi:hypothetical protein